MVIRHRNNGRYRYRYNYRVTISNTDKALIGKCEALLSSLGVKICLYEQDRRAEGKKHLTYVIHITNRAGIEITLRRIMPYLVSKHHKAERMLQILSMWDTLGQVGKQKAYAEFKKLNARVPKRLVRGHTRDA